MLGLEKNWNRQTCTNTCEPLRMSYEHYDLTNQFDEFLTNPVRMLTNAVGIVFLQKRKPYVSKSLQIYYGRYKYICKLGRTYAVYLYLVNAVHLYIVLLSYRHQIEKMDIPRKYNSLLQYISSFQMFPIKIVYNKWQYMYTQYRHADWIGNL